MTLRHMRHDPDHPHLPHVQPAVLTVVVEVAEARPVRDGSSSFSRPERLLGGFFLPSRHRPH
jgi:hypothetical protein